MASKEPFVANCYDACFARRKSKGWPSQSTAVRVANGGRLRRTYHRQQLNKARNGRLSNTCRPGLLGIAPFIRQLPSRGETCISATVRFRAAASDGRLEIERRHSARSDQRCLLSERDARREGDGDGQCGVEEEERNGESYISATMRGFTLGRPLETE